jgi:signal transduction histidine kinase
MNTPLGASNSAIDVGERCIARIVALQEEMDPARMEFLLDSLRKNHLINREANDRMTAILANLKKFISLDGGQREKVDIHEGLDSALALLENEIEGRITIVREYGEVEPVECCPAEINQVFMSLLTNAAEAIEGAGTITIRTSAADGEFRVAVTDTGTGMTPEVQEQLFDPAFSTKGARVKAGMGLLVSLNIVRNHGGRIEVASEPGRGSTFTVIGSCAAGH